MMKSWDNHQGQSNFLQFCEKAETIQRTLKKKHIDKHFTNKTMSKQFGQASNFLTPGTSPNFSCLLLKDASKQSWDPSLLVPNAKQLFFLMEG